MAGMAQSQQGFSVLRIRVLGLDEFFRSKHGIQSAIPVRGLHSSSRNANASSNRTIARAITSL
jgi:hypothetical protein